ncbi:hypothetical protein Ccrd_007116 [Cynara cardunculus var. scolymus]|uniref:Amino acid/polyamine transporter I n=1 Tax=Cynara cardunculus var. scolymus TaxID=59895 RepID=A0A103XHG4_CYNCS|nr:hypothetical protein Ccrd_007116 [Cynara cardunculus var. scolymus]
MGFDIQSDKPNSPIPTGHQPPSATVTAGTIPITNQSITTSATNHKKLTLIPLIFLIYFEVAGGPYGEEPAVKAAGPLLAILGFLIFPFIWSIPEALVTAELSTTFPGNGGFVIWAHKAFGPFCGSLMGSWKYLTGVINIAAFPILCIDYMEKLFPIFSSGLPRTLAILFFTLFLSFVNYTGLNIVGFAAITLGIISLFPFILMSLIAIPQIRPHRWLTVLSAVGLFEAQLSSCAYQLLGMADLGFLPKFFGVRSKWFDTPWVGILISTLITVGFSHMDFTDIVASANFIYSLGMLLEFASFVWLRRKFPTLKRPYRVPLGIPGLVVMCLVPSAFLVLIMVIATKIVFLVSGLMTVGAVLWYFLMNYCKSEKWFVYANGNEIEVEDLQS